MTDVTQGNVETEPSRWDELVDRARAAVGLKPRQRKPTYLFYRHTMPVRVAALAQRHHPAGHADERAADLQRASRALLGQQRPISIIHSCR